MNHYERLGAEQGADFTALKKAFYRRCKECHPDLFENSPAKTEDFKLLVAAFDVLSDPTKRSLYDASLGISRIAEDAGRRPQAFPSSSCVMDSEADDILEELIVGNAPPENATLATLFLDLERTLVFMTFREGRDHYAKRRYREARSLFLKAVWMSPENILYRAYLARCHAIAGELGRAKAQYRMAIEIGNRRVPPQKLVRVRRELDTVSKLQLPWWHRIYSLFMPQDFSSQIPLDERMIEETNRAIAKLEAEERRSQVKRIPE